MRAARHFQKLCQELILDRGQTHRRIVDQDRMARDGERYWPGAETLRGEFVSISLKNASRAQDELAWAKGFGHIVSRTHLKTDNLIHFVHFGRKHENGNMTRRSVDL